MALTFSLIAPASFTPPAVLQRAANALENFGVEVHLPEGLQAPSRYLAGDVDHRLASLYEAYANPETDVVWAVRGGYGCAHLATEIDWTCLPPKPLVGYSDITVLLDQAHRHGHPAIHGPMMKEAIKLEADDPAVSAASRRDLSALLALLNGGDGGSLALAPVTADADASSSVSASANNLIVGPVVSGPIVNGPIVNGPVVGGNLAVLASVAGTSLAFHAPPGAIVILEDVGEPFYRLERDLWQLVQSGGLDDAAAVCLGTFEDCKAHADVTLETLFTAWLRPKGIALYTGLPVGHGRDNAPWRYGDIGKINNGRLQLS